MLPKRKEMYTETNEQSERAIAVGSRLADFLHYGGLINSSNAQLVFDLLATELEKLPTGLLRDLERDIKQEMYTPSSEEQY